MAAACKCLAGARGLALVRQSSSDVSEHGLLGLVGQAGPCLEFCTLRWSIARELPLKLASPARGLSRSGNRPEGFALPRRDPASPAYKRRVRNPAAELS